jgi:hypothetical protein
VAYVHLADKFAGPAARHSKRSTMKHAGMLNTTCKGSSMMVLTHSSARDMHTPCVLAHPFRPVPATPLPLLLHTTLPFFPLVSPAPP